MGTLKRIIAKMLREIADKIEGNNCELSEDEAIEIFETINHQPLSKAEACKYLNLSRSKFDSLVREDKLPKGKKRKGFKEKVFYKNDLDNYLNVNYGNKKKYR